MSRRTSEASKAVREAWENEYQLVQEGKGTRDWNQKQQQDIIDYGKAYDDDGKAFEGHHMKSAEAYPEYQGDAKNIQFLSRTEHQEAHSGSFRNPTNGYYDYRTHQTREFGDGIIPCEVIKLSEPVICLNDEISAVSESAEKKKVSSENKIESAGVVRKISSSPVDKPVAGKGKGLGSTLSGVIESVSGFIQKHPVITAIAGDVIYTVATSLYKAYSETKSGDSEYTGNSGNSERIYVSGDDSVNSVSEYPAERSSPKEHDVSGYDRQQNGKTVHVNPYKRGGKKQD